MRKTQTHNKGKWHLNENALNTLQTTQHPMEKNLPDACTMDQK